MLRKHVSSTYIEMKMDLLPDNNGRQVFFCAIFDAWNEKGKRQ